MGNKVTDIYNTHMVKHSGQVFTPNFLVKNILDFSLYFSNNIMKKHVIDNSCGDGAFLCEIVDRYCKEYIKKHKSMSGLKSDLEKYIHGIELDEIAYKNCLYNLNIITTEIGLKNVKWDIINANSLKETKYNGLMDFVLGNPPYVRVHNLEKDYDDVKSFHFAMDGMTDLYLVFYELGLKMLNNTGKLCYITPSSWLSSLAASNMRKYINISKNLVGLIDLGHFQAFDKATTYTMIALFDKQNKFNEIKYYSYSPKKNDKEYIDTITYDEMSIGKSFYIAPKEDLNLLRAIKTTSTYKYVQVKNGFATLADKIFITDLPFNNFTIPILKASTGKWHRGFFPYDTNGKPIPKKDIFSHPDVAEYLNKNKHFLLKNNTEDKNPYWYLYGRTQAIKDVFTKKYSINSIIKEIKDIKLINVPKGSGVYSGLYILSDVPFEFLEKIIKSEEFINYLAMLKNYKSGGYYTFSSKDLEQYLNYKISTNERAKDFIPVNERGIFESNI